MIIFSKWSAIEITRLAKDKTIKFIYYKGKTHETENEKSKHSNVPLEKAQREHAQGGAHVLPWVPAKPCLN